ncbi:polysaccharide deacetylase family protein [Acetobacterium tundrae]|uniref:Polysaccharide deacetylase family protein n=1 Tax=Acetobacterium tundrae TaxID=132932 RepID=A0ABR6WL15_9FIRM|nr:polysaccharide deacetylase family protein [Acetobacterium tundrae]MBC3796963.1 polysaccharide deacetylase family protein [Acetobacterium tundrae]
MKKKSKLRIKSMPRFISFSLMSLAILIIIGIASVTLVTHVASAINNQKEKYQASALLVDASTDETTSDQDIQTKADAEVTSDANTDEAQQTGTDDPLESIKIRLRNNDTEGLKVVFLTFDDGPSDHTGEVLDILNTYNVKATFFTIRHEGAEAEASYRRIVNEGHTLANHTSSHDYDLYSNPEAFYADVNALDQYQRQITGLTETSHIFRFPGGSINANETCVLGLVKQGWNYADWNVSSGDGGSDPPASDVVAQTIICGCHEHDVSVVLCHAESKPDTRAALSTVIETLQAEGYTFLAMENDFTYPRQLEV